MAKHSFFLGLVTGLLALLPCTIAVEITDLFTVQPGARDGGCDDRAAVLDQWLSEGIDSIDVALNAIDEYRQDPRVRRAMSVIFGIPIPEGPGGPTPEHALNIETVRGYIAHVGNFYNHVQVNGGSMYDRAEYWLFCHSTFLALHDPTDPASDYMGKEMLNQTNDPIRIMDVQKYKDKLAEDKKNKPWWSGDLTDLNGYFFAENGSNYCYPTPGEYDLGITAAIQHLEQGANGQAETRGEIASVIICPYSFDESPQPDSYRDANDLIARRTNLAKAVPKSATLLHEAFHAILRTAFLSGMDEKYDIADCLRLAGRNPSAARKNPENYVFFIAHMYHMRGGEDGDEPWSIRTQWDFDFPRTGRRVYGAVETHQT
ncbi:hypothetical protein C8A01DRAFT_48254 [Parachaetomium inaequale]|uniref:Lysine-specific metallo-endopeptidase domain-containing protein n=1 Tax=Parachaetomium inaequale TaxID=2588326 RepID=A0AAN6SPQ5_9PEZI|nr:hypothetical protein C8A01DRAFT_48254 [Parachaetomium inaequale]